MKKLLSLSLAIVCGVSFAAGMDSESSCMQYRQQMKSNHAAIDAAYHKNDACTMGKLMIQNRQMFESHPDCFPKMEKMMQNKPKQPTSN